MNKRERDEYEKLLELCTRKDKELTEARHRIVELEVRLEEATTVREQHWATVWTWPMRCSAACTRSPSTRAVSSRSMGGLCMCLANPVATKTRPRKVKPKKEK